MPRVDENGNCRGLIGGLLLHPRAWYVLRRENINTLNKLRAVADRLEQFHGVGPETARAIRAELARVGSAADGDLTSGRPMKSYRTSQKGPSSGDVNA
jgi:hypothetical protein